MATLDELMQIKGVVAAGEFTVAGELVDFRSSMNMPRDQAGMTAQFCSTVSIMFNTFGVGSGSTRLARVPVESEEIPDAATPNCRATTRSGSLAAHRKSHAVPRYACAWARASRSFTATQ